MSKDKPGNNQAEWVLLHLTSKDIIQPHNEVCVYLQQWKVHCVDLAGIDAYYSLDIQQTT